MVVTIYLTSFACSIVLYPCSCRFAHFLPPPVMTLSSLIKERAECNGKEKAALETLKMRLEADKRKVEDALDAEHNLAIDWDALLERSKKRELELDEGVAALHRDLDTLSFIIAKACEVKLGNPSVEVWPMQI
jgi:hypothetical protein